MTIHDIHPSHRPDPQQNQQAGGAGNVESGGAQPSQTEEAPGASQQIQDQVEISPEARAAHAQQADNYPMIDFARKALLDIPPLDPKRVEDIFKRVQAGYYSQPNVIENIAQEVTQQFKQVTPPEAGSGPDAAADNPSDV